MGRDSIYSYRVKNVFLMYMEINKTIISIVYFLPTQNHQ